MDAKWSGTACDSPLQRRAGCSGSGSARLLRVGVGALKRICGRGAREPAPAEHVPVAGGQAQRETPGGRGFPRAQGQTGAGEGGSP